MESFFREHARRLDDFLWLLAPASQPELRSLTVGDGFTSFPSREDWAPLAGDAPLMLLLHREDRPRAIDSLVLILAATEREWTKALSSERHGYPLSLELLPGAVDSDWVLLSAIATPGAPTDALYPFIARIFARFLVSGRPLRNYHGSFMLPLDLRLDAELEQAVDAIPALAIASAGQVERCAGKQPAATGTTGDDPHQLLAEYLATPLQQRLFQTDIIHWRLPADQRRDWTLQVEDRAGPGFADGRTITDASLDSVSLHQYYNGLLLLVLQVSMPMDLATTADDEYWWQPLLFSSDAEWPGIYAAQVARWLRFTERLARLYSIADGPASDPSGDPPGDRDQSLLRLIDRGRTLAEMPPDSPFSEVVAFLLRRFLPSLPGAELQRDRRLRQVAGPWMFSHCAYTLQGPAPADGYQSLFDRAGPGPVGADNPVPAQPCRSGQAEFTALGNTFIGCNERHGRFVAPVQVPYLFAGLQIPVLFYRASLDLFERRLGAATGDLRQWPGPPPIFDRIHADVIEFIDRHWFTSLSALPEATVITERMIAAQDLPGRYRQLADKIARTHDYVASPGRSLARLYGLAGAGVLLAVVALVWLSMTA